MNSIRSNARRRGLRMAAQVASIAGVVAASAALSHAAPARSAAAGIAPSESIEVSEDGKGVGDQLGDALKFRSSSGCGCSPCWGPPAPPAMRPELFEEGLS
ncbi:MAG: hypothetical protein ABJE95_38635 [Byssovorax sp.]